MTATMNRVLPMTGWWIDVHGGEGMGVKKGERDEEETREEGGEGNKEGEEGGIKRKEKRGKGEKESGRKGGR